MTDKIDTASRHMTTAEDNIFSDLGFSDAQASQLLAESNAEIEQALVMKKALMTSIAGWIKSEGIRQVDAATLLHVSRPRVSDIVNQKTEKFTLDSLVSMAGNIGKKVTLIIE
ncbi:TPA: helix-turn-helix domain-containing protein [Yersinia enterocolitica]|uniref:helix-turn-helix domain-containing protein n=1 Tax=Yersinia enterocolitica TaxID=630 RepID=UPI00155AF3EB|nr:XRE family transcriptional regulator [Yersinia enterocolitica]EKN3560236.1 XRE family transcriptional regulator [Yersinia enterocolitica]EKN3738118.1 XRE family transcriptional regulator [Yersinia enterocolitica]EKN5984226.1 XRE family transcriptional regulator [Yersinia enterocolitica]EKN5990004.1 XRE family transcriptional regulator [Yersinia enterocolitica]EKN6095660.1 XRE family transcriptional regulator [Yersinia enterocolitica]